jgi:bilirubin oxidase
MIIVRDTEETQLNLPRTYGVDDFPVVIQDRKYSLSGNFQLAALGDSILINGTANAYVQLPAQVVRLRLLNGSNARVYNIGFNDNRYFDVIASDGSLLDQPVSRNRLIISNGERYEILLDLTGQEGSVFLMMSYATEMLTDIPGAAQGMGMDASYLNGVDFPLMQIQVTAPTSNPITTVPNTLINLPAADTTGITRYRFKILSGQGMISMGNFFIDGKQFDPNIINDTVILNEKELWEFVNVSNMAHPMHIHGVQFRIVQRNGNPPQSYESGWKDGVLVHSMESVKLVMRFEYYSNDTLPYVYHCHNLAHEDMGMMLSFIVTDTSVVTSATAIRFQDLTVIRSEVEWIIRYPFRQLMTAEVRDMTGRLLQRISSSDHSDEIRIQHTHLPAGIYLIQLKNTGNLITVKAVK